MAVNRFGFPFQNTAELAASNITANTQLSTDGANIAVLTPDAAYSVAMPDPSLCEGQLRQIVNTTVNALTIRQYASGAFTGAAIALTGVAAGTLQTGVSVAGTPKYASAVYYCNGTNWTAVTANANPT